MTKEREEDAPTLATLQLAALRAVGLCHDCAVCLQLLLSVLPALAMY